MSAFAAHIQSIRACTLCAERFAKTATAHTPRPVAWLSQTAPILIIGQAPGARVHDSGRPFTDPSGDRLRDWMGIDQDTFYDQSKLAIFPMAFCFPGYSATGSDLPPPKICATTWRHETRALMPQVKLFLLIGGYAQSWHLGTKNVTQTVENWRSFGPNTIPLPHPSWRNTGWIRKKPLV
jgi:uracil-DNA glycosylase